MPNRNTPMALIYDFDGTLSPSNLQENSFIPDIGMTPGTFWEEVNQLAKKQQADRVLMYMYLMLEKARAAQVSVHRDDFKKRGSKIGFFKGVNDWFPRINEYGTTKSVRIEHYVVSSGNAEMIEGTQIAQNFQKIYASRFKFDENDVPCWPALAINYTTKTQFLFRINKGAHDLSDDSEINRFVEMKDRPLPFDNMVYIGDGETDVPCFRLVKDLGGLSIAVFRPHTKDARKKAHQFIQDGRVHCAAPADYTENGELDQLVRAHIDFVSTRDARNQAIAKGRNNRPRPRGQRA